MDQKPTEGLSRKEILRTSSDFRSVFKKGERRRTEHFNIYLNRTDGCTRIGLTVSRKIGNAVVRNTIKRKIREYFRKNKIRFQKTDTVIVARKGCGNISTQSVQNELGKALQNKRQ